MHDIFSSGNRQIGVHWTKEVLGYSPCFPGCRGVSEMLSEAELRPEHEARGDFDERDLCWWTFFVCVDFSRHRSTGGYISVTSCHPDAAHDLFAQDA